MENLIKPSFVPKAYSQNEVVYIKDFMQMFLYWKNGVQPLDIYVGQEDKKLTAVFSKKETRPLYEKYRKYELK